MAPYTASSSLLSPGRIGQARWADALGQRCGPIMAASVATIYHTEAARRGLNPDLALAQACEECAWFTSGRWLHQWNPCGLGITSDDVLGVDFKTPENGIRAHLDHLCCYAYGADCPVDMFITQDPRHSFHDANPALSHLQDDTRKWATKPGYVSRILAIVNRLLPPDEPQERPMALTIHEAIIPKGNSNRPGTKLTLGRPTKVTVHETGNVKRGANALMHRNFSHGDDGWGGGGHPARMVNGQWEEEYEGVSFHYTVDDTEGYHLLPDDEKGYHAGDGLAAGSGGSNSIAIETCVNSDGDWAKTKANLAELIARLLTKHNLGIGDVVQHWNWSKKNCPQKLRANNNREWNEVIETVRRKGIVGQGGSTTGTAAGDVVLVTPFINEVGEACVTINYRGKAKQILGVNIQDAGMSVLGMDGATYDRSVLANEGKPWTKRTA